MHCNKRIQCGSGLIPWYKQGAGVCGAKNAWWGRKLFCLLFAFGGLLCFERGVGKAYLLASRAA